ncbi:uncharacterized protein LOC132294556 isoform X2 [Cornus florida]|uniref:uncharacterized protein LOC132294556 isoform X2 n=1 Tax=Cornus florida TaxID=4283 RepID=UPI0028A22A94|nr:uncharacterized protein LOC132294556 isoform X2 [Cornus florida]
MGLDGSVAELENRDNVHQAWAIYMHAFSDLSHVSPVVFLYLLKECYFNGTCKATKKFRILQQQVHQVLCNAPQPGPAIFIAHCLYVLPIFEAYSGGFSHLIISALRRFLKLGTTLEDLLEAKSLAAQLFVCTVEGSVIYDEGVLIKILEVFDVNLTDIEKITWNSDLKYNGSLVTGQRFVEQYIFELIKSQSYMTAVTLLEHFSIRGSGESFLLTMMQNKQFRAAEKWATFMGKQMLCVLVQEFVDKNLLKYAYEVIKKNNLRQEFPEVYHKCKESSLKKLAEKGCWDVAEAKTNSDRQLLEYLVYLAMEAGYSEKVDELCDKYSLKGFVSIKEPEASLLQSRYLQLDELILEDIVWVDEVNGLHDATRHIEGCKVIGIDCEWKPNYVKGSKPNKVSIMQIASEKMAFIFDLIKLFNDVPDILDNCLSRILHSPSILKLGYNFQCDVKQLAYSYGQLGCFKHYEMLLDIQNMFKEPRGGLSGLAQKILGAGLNKTRRNSNWEQRPLSRNQVSRMDNHPKKTGETRSKKECDGGIDEPPQLS